MDPVTKEPVSRYIAAACLMIGVIPGAKGALKAGSKGAKVAAEKAAKNAVVKKIRNYGRLSQNMFLTQKYTLSLVNFTRINQVFGGRKILQSTVKQKSLIGRFLN